MCRVGNTCPRPSRCSFEKHEKRRNARGVLGIRRQTFTAGFAWRTRTWTGHSLTESRMWEYVEARMLLSIVSREVTTYMLSHGISPLCVLAEGVRQYLNSTNHNLTPRRAVLNHKCLPFARLKIEFSPQEDLPIPCLVMRIQCLISPETDTPASVATHSSRTGESTRYRGLVVSTLASTDADKTWGKHGVHSWACRAAFVPA